jgi:hypothetical protein
MKHVEELVTSLAESQRMRIGRLDRTPWDSVKITFWEIQAAGMACARRSASPIVGDRDTACQQDTRSERIEGEEGRSFEREDVSILPCDRNRHAPEDQLRPNGIGRRSRSLGTSPWSRVMRGGSCDQPCAADECECERDERDSPARIPPTSGEPSDLERRCRPRKPQR